MIDPISPPHVFATISVASSIPSNAEFGSIPLSNLYLASLTIFSFLPAIAIFFGQK